MTIVYDQKSVKFYSNFVKTPHPRNIIGRVTLADKAMRHGDWGIVSAHAKGLTALQESQRQEQLVHLAYYHNLCAEEVIGAWTGNRELCVFVAGPEAHDFVGQISLAFQKLDYIIGKNTEATFVGIDRHPMKTRQQGAEGEGEDVHVLFKDNSSLIFK